MKFYIAKGNKVCRHCNGHILRGEIYLLHSFKNPSNNRYCSVPYHYECFGERYIEKLRTQALYYLGQMKGHKKSGRPRKYWDIKEAERKKALIRYHRKAGNEDRAKEVEIELEELLLTSRL